MLFAIFTHRRMYPSTHHGHTARLFSSERRWRWKTYQLLPRRTALLARRAMCSRVARVGTRTSFDAEQKNRHQTHRLSHSARMTNIRRVRARTLSAHPDSRSRGECSAMCGGSNTWDSGRCCRAELSPRRKSNSRVGLSEISRYCVRQIRASVERTYRTEAERSEDGFKLSPWNLSRSFGPVYPRLVPGDAVLLS
jgi:hypothetical protein